eukprot:GILK01011732.1.p1 GENE.GILK01011732.1~~GILK01011732.1.p1  ORF type:complete len:556 (-),score=79.46 GILK01011732.1:130-1752(-)
MAKWSKTKQLFALYLILSAHLCAGLGTRTTVRLASEESVTAAYSTSSYPPVGLDQSELLRNVMEEAPSVVSSSEDMPDSVAEDSPLPQAADNFGDGVGSRMRLRERRGFLKSVGDFAKDNAGTLAAVGAVAAGGLAVGLAAYGVSQMMKPTPAPTPPPLPPPPPPPPFEEELPVRPRKKKKRRIRLERMEQAVAGLPCCRPCRKGDLNPFNTDYVFLETGQAIVKGHLHKKTPSTPPSAPSSASSSADHLFKVDVAFHPTSSHQLFERVNNARIDDPSFIQVSEVSSNPMLGMLGGLAGAAAGAAVAGALAPPPPPPAAAPAPAAPNNATSSSSSSDDDEGADDDKDMYTAYPCCRVCGDPFYLGLKNIPAQKSQANIQYSFLETEAKLNPPQSPTQPPPTIAPPVAPEYPSRNDLQSRYIQARGHGAANIAYGSPFIPCKIFEVYAPKGDTECCMECYSPWDVMPPFYVDPAAGSGGFAAPPKPPASSEWAIPSAGGSNIPPPPVPCNPGTLFIPEVKPPPSHNSDTGGPQEATTASAP